MDCIRSSKLAGVQGLRWLSYGVLIPKWGLHRAIVLLWSLGKNITKGGASAWRIHGMEVTIAMKRKAGWKWNCGCASHQELMLSSGGENQKDDRPEAGSRSLPIKSMVMWLSKCQSLKGYEERWPCGITGGARSGQVTREQGAPWAAPRLSGSESQLYLS